MNYVHDKGVAASITAKSQQLLGEVEAEAAPEATGKPTGASDAGKGSAAARTLTHEEAFHEKNQRMAMASQLGIHYSDPRLGRRTDTR